jgi:hypothetical protein
MWKRAKRVQSEHASWKPHDQQHCYSDEISEPRDVPRHSGNTSPVSARRLANSTQVGDLRVETLHLVADNRRT